MLIREMKICDDRSSTVRRTAHDRAPSVFHYMMHVHSRSLRAESYSVYRLYSLATGWYVFAVPPYSRMTQRHNCIYWYAFTKMTVYLHMYSAM